MSDTKLGPRGERGERGPTGPTGPAGSTGPTGPSTGALIGRQVFDTAVSGTYTPTPGTRRAIVRGCGGGGGGGGVGETSTNGPAVASGGNSGTSIEAEVTAPPNTFLTGGPITVGAGSAGGVGLGLVSPGGDSTLLIGGTLLTAPGGTGGNTGGNTSGLTVSPFANAAASGVDYQAFDLGGYGFAKANLTATGFDSVAGTGGSGDYGGGGRGAQAAASAGFDADGNGAGGGGALNTTNNPTTFNGGAGTDGLWIIEEYS